MNQSHIVYDYLYSTTTLKQIIIGSATLVTIRVIIFVYNRYRTFQTFKNVGIPGPKPNLWDGNLSEYLKEEAYFAASRKYRQAYGKVFGYYVGDMAVLVIVDPKILRKFLIDNSAVFDSRSRLYIDTRPLSKSILFAAGDRWRSMRKTLTPAFSQYRMKGEEATKFIDDSIALMLNYLSQKHKKCKESSEPMVIDIQELMKATALHLISSMALRMDGIEVKEYERHVKVLDQWLEQADGAVVHWAIRIPVLQSVCSFIGNNITQGKLLMDISKTLKSRMNEIVSVEKSSKSFSHDIFEKMVHLHKEGSLTEEEVLGNSIAILFAGYDTTSTTLSYFFWVLSKYPEIQERLRSEIMSHGPESAYLRMVLNETMRLYPTVVSFTRRTASRDITIDGLTIKKDVVVVVDAWLIHHDPEIWPEPFEFNPERFADMSKIDTCAFVPFGVGQRLCLGYQLAMLEMKLIITELLMTYKFNLIGPDVLDLITSANVLTKPREAIKLSLQPLYTK